MEDPETVVESPRSLPSPELHNPGAVAPVALVEMCQRDVAPIGVR